MYTVSIYRYLHVAACKSDPNLIQSLLERLNREQMDWLIDLENKKRMTPLYLAVLGNQPEMVEIFLKNNADPNALAQVLILTNLLKILDRADSNVLALVNIEFIHKIYSLKVIQML